MVDVAGKRKNRGALLGALLFNERIHAEDSRLGARGDRTPNFQGLAAEGGGAKRARAEIKQQPNRTKFKRWGPLEDAILASLVDTYGEENSWEQIASEMSGRTASACEQHWQVMNGQHANGQRPTSQQEANAARTTGLVPAPRPPPPPAGATSGEVVLWGEDDDEDEEGPRAQHGADPAADARRNFLARLESAEGASSAPPPPPRGPATRFATEWEWLGPECVSLRSAAEAAPAHVYPTELVETEEVD